MFRINCSLFLKFASLKRGVPAVKSIIKSGVFSLFITFVLVVDVISPVIPSK